MDAPSSSTGRGPLLALLAALLLAVVAMAPARHGGFIYDDEYYVVQNRQVVAEAPAWTAPLGDQSQSLWRPLTVLSFRAQWDGPQSAGAFLIANILLHVLATGLVWSLARRWGLGGVASFGAAALFATHPVHAEAVGWVSGRAELLACVFVLGAWLAHLSERRGAAALSVALLVAGALSKENALAAPALFVGYDALVRRRAFPWRRHLALAAGVAAVVAGRVAVLERFSPTEAPFGDLAFGDRLTVAWNVLGTAWWKLVWPAPLKVHYHRLELGYGDAWLTTVVVAALAVTAWTLLRGPRRVGVALLLVPVSLVTVLNLVPIGATFAERFLYLPSVLVCLAVGAAVDALVARERAAGRGLGGSVLMLATLVVVAVPTARAAVSVFRDDLTLWAHAARVSPRNPHARYNHGYWLDLAGRDTTRGPHSPGAADELWRSLAIDPSHLYAGFAHQVLGVHALTARDRWLPDPLLAGEHFRAATRRVWDHPAGRYLIDPYINLASVALSSPDAVSPTEAASKLATFLEKARTDGVELPPDKVSMSLELLQQLEALRAAQPSSTPPTGMSSEDGS